MKKASAILFAILFILSGIFLSKCKDTTENNHYQENIKTASITYTSIHVDTNNLLCPNPTYNNCVTCHAGIEPIRDPRSGMMQEIYKVAEKSGYKNNECIVCHGGNPNATTKLLAHKGSVGFFLDGDGPKDFYPDPSSPWININTCGTCHEEQVSTQFTSLMFTEAGKIQGTTWGFGGIQGYSHDVANIAVKEVEAHKRLGTDVYKKYMEKLKTAEPHVFPKSMKALPDAPTAAEVDKNPQLAVYTYLRQECQRCHTGVKGQSFDGDFRGMGCGSCHIPYSNKGLYEGDDPTISKTDKGHMLVHSIQGTREAKVTVHGNSYSGIPTKTCTACHNRGRRIGVSYEGLMETSYSSPFMGGGESQAKIHKKNYIHLQPDVHLKRGMMCQDCHTSGDAHSLGDLAGAIQGAVEIECQDCHGTPSKFPWELPIGYGDEIVGESPATGKGRGVSFDLPDYLKYGTEYPKEDGYLLSARGNPMPHVVRRGDKIVLHSAGGKDIVYSPLKKKVEDDELSLEAKVAMVQTPSHIDKMECYACHATWAPQCYGCHISIDYSKDFKKNDWVQIAENHGKNGQSIDALKPEDIKKIKDYLIEGKVEEQRSFLRWEDPPLVVNGEHRISPAIPGCQTTVSIKGKDGKMKMLNHIFRIPNVEGAGEEGQLGIDIAPLQPHTIQAKARSCESCHANPKSFGYGINSGELYYRPDTNFVMDLLDADSRPIAKQVDTHFTAIPNLSMDWSRFLNEDGKQLQTVGHHFSGSRPLNKRELSKLDRTGVCLSCHQTVPDKNLGVDLLSHVAEYADIDIDNKKHGEILNKSIRLSAWAQILLSILAVLILIFTFRWLYRRKKQ